MPVLKRVTREIDEKNCWKLNTGIEITSTIDDSKKHIDKAKDLKDHSQIVREFKEAFTLYPESIYASKALIDYLLKTSKVAEGDKELDDMIHRANFLLDRKKRNLKTAIRIIETNGEQSEWLEDWEGANKYVREMENEVIQLEKYSVQAENLSMKRPISEDEAQCLELLKQIEEIKDRKNEKRSNQVFEEHISNNNVKNGLRNVLIISEIGRNRTILILMIETISIDMNLMRIVVFFHCI